MKQLQKVKKAFWYLYIIKNNKINIYCSEHLFPNAPNSAQISGLNTSKKVAQWSSPNDFSLTSTEITGLFLLVALILWLHNWSFNWKMKNILVTKIVHLLFTHAFFFSYTLKKSLSHREIQIFLFQNNWPESRGIERFSRFL